MNTTDLNAAPETGLFDRSGADRHSRYAKRGSLARRGIPAKTAFCVIDAGRVNRLPAFKIWPMTMWRTGVFVQAEEWMLKQVQRDED
jgi:hypothetical protein